MPADVTQLRALAADFASAQEAGSAVQVGVRNALDSAKERARQDYRAFPNKGIAKVGDTFSYDTKPSGAVVQAEFGPSKPKGALANIAIWGTPKGGGGMPHPADYMDDKVTDEIASTLDEILDKLS
ncbi:MAG: hypothetical protein HXL63_08535 [Thermobifida sp.]|jgi:hypothetical protein|nr:hypothetical protein [Thermobifida sp.]DAJ32159.1 MAG TPA: hypothetical protein [Bacteriophage sp.]DAM86302.1 MAG TPA: hypothetical protein [Caudoviricetes sp.]DAP99787.1 MAG TPA: hypothetical protein [Caudoviricetes sp.]DAW02764.1 MAG TPA: hypothetical protein [Caudoviricetes sp.]